MIGAIVRDDIVENLIVLEEAQKEELEAALECEIVDARPYGLVAGDLRTANGWTRNAGGEQVVLPLLDAKTYDSYTLAIEQKNEAEEALLNASEETAQEAIDILSGDIEETEEV